jgi:hypothetical protein
LGELFFANQHLDGDRDFTEDRCLTDTYRKVTKSMHISADNLEPFAIILNELCRCLPDRRQNVYHYNNIEQVHHQNLILLLHDQHLVNINNGKDHESDHAYQHKDYQAGKYSFLLPIELLFIS